MYLCMYVYVYIYIYSWIPPCYKSNVSASNICIIHTLQPRQNSLLYDLQNTKPSADKKATVST